MYAVIEDNRSCMKTKGQCAYLIMVGSWPKSTDFTAKTSWCSKVQANKIYHLCNSHTTNIVVNTCNTQLSWRQTCCDGKLLEYTATTAVAKCKTAYTRGFIRDEMIECFHACRCLHLPSQFIGIPTHNTAQTIYTHREP